MASACQTSALLAACLGALLPARPAGVLAVELEGPQDGSVLGGPGPSVDDPVGQVELGTHEFFSSSRSLGDRVRCNGLTELLVHYMVRSRSAPARIVGSVIPTTRWALRSRGPFTCPPRRLPAGSKPGGRTSGGARSRR